jgi:hypothetical protein
MEFSIDRTSDLFVYSKIKPHPCNGAYLKPDSWYIEINSLEDIIKLQLDCGSPIIINSGHIEIYDDDRE